MDLKAMAKSKRSHTQHHQPTKPHRSSKTPSTLTATADTSDPKVSKTNREGKERKMATKPTSLPSNWGRYVDEVPEEVVEEIPINSDSDESSRFAASKAKTGTPYVVKPKSKGADFSSLIAQAKESPSTYFPSFDDSLSDFYKGLGPMLAIREESILWSRDDDFLVEDEATTPKEAPSLTLDLQALAEQLAKVDLAKRLFIEADLLPPEMRTQEPNKADYQVPFKTTEKQKNAAVAQNFNELYSLYLAEEGKTKIQNDVDKDGAMSSSAVTSSYNPDPASEADDRESKLDDLGFLEIEEMSQVSHVEEQDATPSLRLEAAAAEAEFDMLLNSFSEIKVFDNPGTRAKAATCMEQQENPVSVWEGSSITHGASLQHLPGQSSPTFHFTSSLDDALDDLLKETSNPSDKDVPTQSMEIKPVSLYHPSSSSSLSSLPSSKSKVFEDFDSWFDTI